MLAALLIIAGLTLVIYAINKVKHIYCPICLATVLVWMGLTAGLYFKWFAVNPLFLGILIGVSLGAANERFGSKFGLIWKVSLVVFGAPAIYFLVQKEITYTIYLLIALIFFTAISTIKFSGKPASGGASGKLPGCCD